MIKSWVCIEECGACCKFDLGDRENIKRILSDEDIKLINEMTGPDGWCRFLDKKSKKCSIYFDRPHFCKVNEFSKNLSDYKKNGDDFLIKCCKQHIKSIYGRKSLKLKEYKKRIREEIR